MRPILKSALLVLLLAGMALSASCQRSSQDAVSPARNVSLLHYFSFSSSFSGTMDAIATDFNRQSKAHRLTATPLDHESFKASIHEDLKRGNTADLYSYWAGSRVEAILDSLMPLDEVLPPAEMDRLFGESVARSASRYREQTYLVPLTQHLVGFFYNKKIFAENGLTPPANWAEFKRAGEVLKSRGIVPVALGSKAKWPAQFWFDYLLLRTAPVEYRQRLLSGKAALTDPEVVRVFGLWRDLIRSGLFNDNPNAADFDSGAGLMVHRGEAAMTLMGTWLVGYYSSTEIQWGAGTDYGFFPFPVIDPGIPRVALGPVDGLILPKSARNIEGARKVLLYMASASPQERISLGSGAMAPLLGVDEKSGMPGASMRQAIREETNRSASWAFNYDLATAPERAQIGLALFSRFLEFPDQYRVLLNQAESRMRQVNP